MEIITRKEMGWPATPAPARNTNTGMVIHYDGNPSPLGLAKKVCNVACRAYWKNTRAFHMGPSRQWLDIGYCGWVCPHGNHYVGRDYGHEQAAQPGGNTTWASLTLGLAVGEKPTEAAINGVRKVRQMWMDRGMKAAIRCHSDFIQTSCPGDILRGMVRDGTFAGKATTTPASNWTDELMKALPTLGEGADNYNVKSVRALVFARGLANDIPSTDLKRWLNVTKFDRDLTNHVIALQQEAFPKDPEEWDGIVGPKGWAILYTP